MDSLKYIRYDAKSEDGLKISRFEKYRKTKFIADRKNNYHNEFECGKIIINMLIDG
jgi:hypothetical protein